MLFASYVRVAGEVMWVCALRLLKALEFPFQPNLGSAYCEVTQK